MSTYNKMKKRRDHWKKKTVATGADLRYHKKENKRIKKERDSFWMPPSGSARARS
jgi:hypothetical protein